MNWKLVVLATLLLAIVAFNAFHGLPTRATMYHQLHKLTKLYGLSSYHIEIPESTRSEKTLRVHILQNACLDTTLPPLVFLHGTRGYAVRFHGVIQRFPDRRCFAIDLPGYGISDTPSWHNTQGSELLDHFSFLLSNCIKRLVPGEKVVLVGHSLGALLALNVSHTHPQLVERTLLCACPGLFPNLGKNSWYYAHAFYHNFPNNWCLDDIGSFFLFPLLHLVYDTFCAHYLTQPYSREVNYLKSFTIIKNSRGYWNPPQLDKVLSSTVPLAFVCGDQDTILSYDQYLIACKLNPTLCTYVLEGEDHFFARKPKLFEDVIRHELQRPLSEWSPSDKHILDYIRQVFSKEKLYSYGSSKSVNDSQQRLENCFQDVLNKASSNITLHKTKITKQITRYQKE